MSAHLGGALSAFVDGELGHTRREEVLVHLTHCVACRHEVDVLRGLKARLVAEVTAPEHLTARLLAATAPLGHPMLVPRPQVARRRVFDSQERWRRTAFGLGALGLAVGGAFLVGGPPTPGPAAPLDPTNAGFVQGYETTSYEVPFVGVQVVPVAQPTP